MRTPRVARGGVPSFLPALTLIAFGVPFAACSSVPALEETTDDVAGADSGPHRTRTSASPSESSDAYDAAANGVTTFVEDAGSDADSASSLVDAGAVVQPNDSGSPVDSGNRAGDAAADAGVVDGGSIGFSCGTGGAPAVGGPPIPGGAALPLPANGQSTNIRFTWVCDLKTVHVFSHSTNPYSCDVKLAPSEQDACATWQEHGTCDGTATLSADGTKLNIALDEPSCSDAHDAPNKCDEVSYMYNYSGCTRPACGTKCDGTSPALLGSSSVGLISTWDATPSSLHGLDYAFSPNVTFPPDSVGCSGVPGTSPRLSHSYAAYAVPGQALTWSTTDKYFSAPSGKSSNVAAARGDCRLVVYAP